MKLSLTVSLLCCSAMAATGSSAAASKNAKVGVLFEKSINDPLPVQIDEWLRNVFDTEPILSVQAVSSVFSLCNFFMLIALKLETSQAFLVNLNVVLASLFSQLLELWNSFDLLIPESAFDENSTKAIRSHMNKLVQKRPSQILTYWYIKPIRSGF